jgi:FMN reductase
MHEPRIVGIGGTTRQGSSTERALRYCLDACERLGARTELFGADRLLLPHYAPEQPDRVADAVALVDALRSADGIIVATPGYHGGMSGLVKNALDYTEDMREDERAYFDGRAVGLIVCAYGWQATTTTLSSARSIAHALRGWPTPFAATLNSSQPMWDVSGRLVDESASQQLTVVAGQVVQFAQLNAGAVR